MRETMGTTFDASGRIIVALAGSDNNLEIRAFFEADVEAEILGNGTGEHYHPSLCLPPTP